MACAAAASAAPRRRSGRGACWSASGCRASPTGGRRPFRRPAAARGDRALPRARAHAGAPRRAARRARSQAARAYEDRAEAAAGDLQHDVRLHHPRPVRGAGDVRPRRRDERRAVSSRSARRASSTTTPRRRSSPASSARPTSGRAWCWRRLRLGGGAPSLRQRRRGHGQVDGHRAASFVRPEASRSRPTRRACRISRTASKAASRRCCSTAPTRGSSSILPVSTRRFAPRCRRPGRSRASAWAPLWSSAGRPRRP